MCIELPTPHDRLSTEHVTSLPKKKFRTTSMVLIVDLKEDEEGTYLDEMGGGDGGEFQAIVM
jgi:hypothetical protein